MRTFDYRLTYPAIRYFRRANTGTSFEWIPRAVLLNEDSPQIAIEDVSPTVLVKVILALHFAFIRDKGLDRLFELLLRYYSIRHFHFISPSTIATIPLFHFYFKYLPAHYGSLKKLWSLTILAISYRTWIDIYK